VSVWLYVVVDGFVDVLVLVFGSLFGMMGVMWEF